MLKGGGGEVGRTADCHSFSGKQEEEEEEEEEEERGRETFQFLFCCRCM